jgi:hypothetical protein
MKKPNFLKKYIGPIVLVVGFLWLLLTISLVKAVSKGEDKGVARNAGQNSTLNFQRETLTELSYLGGISIQMSPEMARQDLGQSLQELIEENTNFAAQYDAFSESSDDEINDAAFTQVTAGIGIFADLSSEYRQSLANYPQLFIASGVRASEIMRAAAQELLTMYDNRVERLMQKSGMSADEVFDLARETKTNLFAYPDSFAVTIDQLGLNWKEFDSQAAGVNFDWDYLRAKADLAKADLDDNYSLGSHLISLSDESSGYFDALIDSLGSFFNACTKC